MTQKTVPDLFRCYREKLTGHWIVGKEPGRTLYLDSGDIVFATSTYQADKLTSILVERGKLTQEQLDYALANMKSGISVGKNLIEMDFLSQSDLLEAARFQVERIVCSALAEPDTPIFEQKDELDENIVRLPLDTPLMLFRGMMRIEDREGILELLGPLNQVVQLHGTRLKNLELPPELAKIVVLMDGTHTIMEISSQTATESLKTAAFALFLREIGYGKLYELPPLDRQALDKALTVPDPTPPPNSIPSPRDMLFKQIEDAGKKTITLDHLAEMLDKATSIGGNNDPIASRLDEDYQQPPEPKKTPEQEPIGRVIDLTKESVPGATPPMEEDPPIIISQDDDVENDDSLPPIMNKTEKSTNWIAIFAVIIVIVFAMAAFSLWKLKIRVQNSEQAPFKLEMETDIPLPTENDKDESASEAALPALPVTDETGDVAPSTSLPVEVAPARPAPERETKQDSKAVDYSTAARLKSITEGDTALAVAQGREFQKSLPANTWTILLVMACQSETLQNGANAFAPSRPELFLTAYRLRDGRPCFRLFYGKFTSKATAEAEVRKLPKIFIENNIPKVMQLNEILTVQ